VDGWTVNSQEFIFLGVNSPCNILGGWEDDDVFWSKRYMLQKGCVAHTRTKRVK